MNYQEEKNQQLTNLGRISSDLQYIPNILNYSWPVKLYYKPLPPKNKKTKTQYKYQLNEQQSNRNEDRTPQ